MTSRNLWLLALGCCLVCGCSQSPSPPSAASNGPNGAETAGSESAAEPNATGSGEEPGTAETTAAPETVELQLMEWPGVEELIASHQGDIVVVDLWATYCDPCRREFPGLVALSQAHPEDVTCISVSLDEVDDQEQALDFLREHHATFENVLCTTDWDTLYDEILKVGAIPVIYVYGRDGEMLKRFTTIDGGDVTYEDHIVPFVEELLAEG